MISLKDKHHADALRLVDSLLGEVKISPYSFIELDLLLKSGEILVEDLSAFYDVLSELLRYRQIDTYPLRFEYHREAFRLRGGHKNLTYFDSLHAAVAIVENLEIVSYDKGYERLTNVKYIHPKKYA